jgi:HK97 family phage prohead protease
MSAFLTRAVNFEPLPEEERASQQSDGRTLEGYAAVFDADTEINSWEGHFKERIVRGAFRKTLKERTPVLQFDHGHDSRFGNLPIGSFEKIVEDKHGLRVQARLFDHAEPIRQAIEAGAVTGMSFRFKVVRDSWADDKGNPITDRNELMEKLYSAKKGDKPLQRTIKEVKLMEAGPVVFPAYPQTTVGVRSMTDDERKRAIEDLTSGFTPEVTDELREQEGAELDAVREALVSAGYTLESAVDAVVNNDFSLLRAENPFAKKDGDDKAKGKDGEKPKPCADCAKAGEGKKCEKHAAEAAKAKKTSGGDGKKPPFGEKKSEDDTSSAPEVGDDAAEPRSEDQDDAAQAGTSSGMTKNARERALSLLDI